MGKKAVAFLKATKIAGFELACSKCPVVLQITHDPLQMMPKHRCNGKPLDFDIVLELDELVLRPSRIDRYWLT